MTALQVLNQEEYDDLINHFTVIYQFSDIRERIMMFVYAKNDIINSLENGDIFGIKRGLLAALSNFQSYIDYLGAQIVRNFGKKSPEQKIFEKAKSNEFDTHLSYRFFSKLRNMVIHSRFPHLNGGWNQTPNQPKTSNIVLSQEDLLTFTEWGKIVKNDIEKLNDGIDLMPLFEEAQECLKMLAVTYLSFTDLKKLYDSCKHILTFKKQIEKKGETLMVFYQFIENGKVKQFDKISYFPFQDAEIALDMISKK